MKINSAKRREVITLVVVFAGVLLISALAVYLIGGRGRTTNTGQQPTTTTTVRPSPEQGVPTAGTNETFIDRLFGTHNNEAFLASERWAENIGRLSLRLLLASLLGAALAFRPRKQILTMKPNPYVS